MSQISHIAKFEASPFLRDMGKDPSDPASHNANMQNQPANGGPNYLEDWIEYRGMAKGEVAAKAGISASMMSELISGKKKLTALYLRKLSKVLDCHPGDIIEFHPHEVPPEIRDRFLRATKEQLKQIAQLMDVVMPYDPGSPAQNGNH